MQTPRGSAEPNSKVPVLLPTPRMMHRSLAPYGQSSGGPRPWRRGAYWPAESGWRNPTRITGLLIRLKGGSEFSLPSSSFQRIS